MFNRFVCFSFFVLRAFSFYMLLMFNPKAVGLIPAGRQFFALLVFSSRRSGGSSLGFRAGSVWASRMQND